MDRQTVGNAGLYYVCWLLTKLNWNVLPTSRNAKGIDVLIYSTRGKRKLGIQVKALSNRAAAGFSKNRENIFADYYVVAVGVQSESPKCYVLSAEEVHKGLKENKDGSLWLDPPQYEGHQGCWDKIGSGIDD